MSSISPEKANEIAKSILEYNENDEVKRALVKLGYKIVPNSLKLIIEGLEKSGYTVQKNEKELIDSKKEEKQVQIEKPIINLPLFLGRNVLELIPNENSNLSNEVSTPESIDQETILSKWDDIIHEAKKLSISFGGFITHASPVGIENDQLIIAFNPQSSYHLGQLKKDRNYKTLNEIISRIYGKDLTLNPIIQQDVEIKEKTTLQLPLFSGRKI